MKKISVILFLFFVNLIFAQELSLENSKIFASKQKNHFLCLQISPGLLYGASVGYGKIISTKTAIIENIWQIHYHQGGDFVATGLILQANLFKSKERKGFYFLANGGFDYTKRKHLFNFGSIGGTEEDDNEEKIYNGFFPNLSLGFGYSKKISKSSYLRISLDIGFKVLISNLNFSYCF